MRSVPPPLLPSLPATRTHRLSSPPPHASSRSLLAFFVYFVFSFPVFCCCSCLVASLISSHSSVSFLVRAHFTVSLLAVCLYFFTPRISRCGVCLFGVVAQPTCFLLLLLLMIYHILLYFFKLGHCCLCVCVCGGFALGLQSFASALVHHPLSAWPSPAHVSRLYVFFFPLLRACVCVVCDAMLSEVVI